MGVDEEMVRDYWVFDVTYEFGFWREEEWRT
jgi:hypothetical protein